MANKHQTFAPTMLASTGLIWMTTAPAAEASSGKLAAGIITPELPTESITSQFRADCAALSRLAMAGLCRTSSRRDAVAHYIGYGAAA